MGVLSILLHLLRRVQLCWLGYFFCDNSSISKKERELASVFVHYVCDSEAGEIVVFALAKLVHAVCWLVALCIVIKYFLPFLLLLRPLAWDSRSSLKPPLAPPLDTSTEH